MWESYLGVSDIDLFGDRRHALRGEMSQSARALFVWASHPLLAPHSNFFSFRAIAVLPTLPLLFYS